MELIDGKLYLCLGYEIGWEVEILGEVLVNVGVVDWYYIVYGYVLKLVKDFGEVGVDSFYIISICIVCCSIGIWEGCFSSRDVVYD